MQMLPEESQLEIISYNTNLSASRVGKMHNLNLMATTGKELIIQERMGLLINSFAFPLNYKSWKMNHLLLFAS